MNDSTPSIQWLRGSDVVADDVLQELRRMAARPDSGTPYQQLRLSDGRTVRVSTMGPERNTTLIVLLVMPSDPFPSLERLRERFRLTPREAQVARLMADGSSDKQIARELGITPGCAARHGEKVRGKLGISSRRYVRTVLLAD